MTEVAVEYVTDEDIIAERATLLQRAGMTEEELVERARAYELDQHQQAILRQLDQLNYLTSDLAHKPWHGDHTDLVHVLWGQTVNGANIAGDDADQIASAIMNSQWKAAAEHHAGVAHRERLAAIRRLYDDTCARTVYGCSDDLELFLADLREALDGNGS